MHSSSSGLQPAWCYDCGIQPRSHSCLQLRIDEYHLIAKRLLRFSLRRLQQRAMSRGAAGSWGCCKEETIHFGSSGFILASFCFFPLNISNQTTHAAISHPTAAIWMGRDHDAICSPAGGSIYSGFGERSKKEKQSVKT